MEGLWIIVSIIKLFIWIIFGLAEIAINLLKNCCNSEEPKRKKRIESEECAVCLESIKNRIEVTCGHEYCAECIIQLWERSKEQVICPMCRDQISVIFIEFTKDDDNKDIMQKIHDYNNTYVEKRSYWTQLIEMPHLMRKWVSSIEHLKSLAKEKAPIIYTFVAILYLLSPIDLFPEIILGPFGYLDDVLVVVSIFIAVSKIFLRRYAAEH